MASGGLVALRIHAQLFHGQPAVMTTCGSLAVIATSPERVRAARDGGVRRLRCMGLAYDKAP